jgi:hypothetical protein
VFPTDAELDARVAYGAALLDIKRPAGWLDDIDLTILDISDTAFCVGGQLADPGEDPEDAYFTTMNELGLGLGSGAVAHGFTLSDPEVAVRARHLGTWADPTETFAPLTEAWKRLITVRLEATA